MATAVQKWQPILFILVFGFALSLFAQNHTGSDAQNSEVSQTLPRFDGKPHGEYERALDLFFYTANGSNDEFKAFQTLMELLQYKEDVDVVLNRLGKLDDESLGEEDKLRKDNLQESLERKKSELEEKPIQDSAPAATGTVAKGAFSESTTANPFSMPTTSTTTQPGIARKIPDAPLPASVPKRVLASQTPTTAPNAPGKVTSLPTIASAAPTISAPATQGPAPVVVAAYNPPVISSNGQNRNPDAPNFDDGVFDLSSMKESSVPGAGNRSFSDGAPLKIARTQTIIPDSSAGPTRASFTPPETNPGIIKKLGEWVTGFEQAGNISAEATPPATMSKSLERTVPESVSSANEATGLSSLQAFQVQMTAIAE